MISIAWNETYDEEGKSEIMVTVRCEIKEDPRELAPHSFAAEVDQSVEDLPVEGAEADDLIMLSKGGKRIVVSGGQYGEECRVGLKKFKREVFNRLKGAEWHLTLKTGVYWCQFDVDPFLM